MPRAIVFSALGKNTGCALRAYYLARGLSKAGWQVRYVRPAFKSLPYSLEVFFSIPQYLWLALWGKYDLAVGIKPYPNIWLSLLLLKFKRARCIVDVDDLDGAYRGGLAGLLVALAQRPVFFISGLEFSTHHPFLKQYLMSEKRVKPARIFWLCQGVDDEIFSIKKGSRVSLPAVLKGKKLLLFAAHLNVACELPTLLEWIGPFMKEHSKYSLVVAGGGPLQAQFESLVREKGLLGSVYFTGWMKPEEIADWISLVELCLAPYPPSEGNRARVPMKVGEYLACGKKVISNRLEGLKNLWDFLYLCDAEGKDFRQKLGQLLKQGGDGREAKGRAYVQKNLLWDIQVKKFLTQIYTGEPTLK